MIMAISLHFSPKTLPSIHPNVPNSSTLCKPSSCYNCRRQFISTSASSLCFSLSLTPNSIAETPKKDSILSSGIANTKSWDRFYGDGFAIRVPPQFLDLTEPEDYNAGLSLYGDKAKPKTFAARFASPDGYEVVSVITRSSNQLKITFLEAKDVSDFGSLKEAAKLFIPGDATIFSGRTIKIKEDNSYRNYYFYEFGRDEQHVALVAAVNSGKVFVAAASAPQSKWDDDGVKLRSAAVFVSITKPLIEAVLLRQANPTVFYDDFASIEDLRLFLLETGGPSNNDGAQRAPKSRFRLLMAHPSSTVHYFWRKFDDRFMRPVFGGRGFVPFVPRSPTGEQEENSRN